MQSGIQVFEIFFTIFFIGEIVVKAKVFSPREFLLGGKLSWAGRQKLNFW